jgi:hypothetical protein
VTLVPGSFLLKQNILDTVTINKWKALILKILYTLPQNLPLFTFHYNELLNQSRLFEYTLLEELQCKECVYCNAKSVFIAKISWNFVFLNLEMNFICSRICHGWKMLYQFASTGYRAPLQWNPCCLAQHCRFATKLIVPQLVLTTLREILLYGHEQHKVTQLKKVWLVLLCWSKFNISFAFFILSTAVSSQFCFSQ